MKFIALTHTRSKNRVDIRTDLIESLQVRDEGTLLRLTNGRGMYVDETPDEIYAKSTHQSFVFDTGYESKAYEG